MTWEEYWNLFESIATGVNQEKPYDEALYLDYTKLNFSRSKRWMKHGVLNPELVQKVEAIASKQTWVVITEPWCGDAAHSVPFLALLAQKNTNIQLEIQLRDQNSEIDSYLTNGGKSIPKLVIRDESGKDLAIWGPRPADCQVIYNQMQEEKVDFDTLKTGLQNWYNENNGVSLQNELLALLA